MAGSDTMTGWLGRIPMWSKILAAIVAGLAAIGTMIAWGQDAYEHFETSEHHDADVQAVLEVIAQEKKNDRIQRNRRELKRLERDFVANRFSNPAEKELVKTEIEDLKAQILCDEEGICPNG